VGAAGTKETVWDQHIYNDVVESAVFGKEMHRRSHQRMVDPAGGARQAWEAAQGFPQGGEEMSWDVATVDVRAEHLPTTASGAALALALGRAAHPVVSLQLALSIFEVCRWDNPSGFRDTRLKVPAGKTKVGYLKRYEARDKRLRVIWKKYWR